MFLFDTESKQDKRVQWELLNWCVCVCVHLRALSTDTYVGPADGQMDCVRLFSCFSLFFVFLHFSFCNGYLTATTLASSCVKGESVTVRTLEKSAHIFIHMFRVVKQVSHLSGNRAEACLLGRLSNKKKNITPLSHKCELLCISWSGCTCSCRCALSNYTRS